MSAIEALYVFDEHNYSILEHVYNARPASAKVLLPLYLAYPAPRPSLIYLPETSPPTLLHSMIQDRLLFLSPTSVDTEPLLVLEFLHRVADVLEDFLGSPLLAGKIESSYDVVAQLVSEMCDGGTVSNTEPNALREVVEAPTWMNKLLGGVGLPGYGALLPAEHALLLTQKDNSAPPSLNSAASGTLRPRLSPTPSDPNKPVIPWRRSNVRHTSNELYVDIVETLSVTIAPSGRTLSAFANGTIAFTSKVSGVPDLLLTLAAPGGKAGIEHALQLPVFHPCVRLARWKERPGELSFIPPDGRFVLAGYEVDLLGPHYLEQAVTNLKYTPSLHLPASVSVYTSLGPTGSEFEVRLSLDTRFVSSAPSSSSSAAVSSLSSHTIPRSSSRAGSSAGTSSAPTVEDLLISIPIPSSVRNLTDIRPSRGEAHYSPGDGAVEWRISGKDSAALGNSAHRAGGVAATLRCTAVGALDVEGSESSGLELKSETWGYDEDATSAYQSSSAAAKAEPRPADRKDLRKIRRNAVLMPTSAMVSFQVKGWLASGIRVEKLVVDVQKSRGLGQGVTPYKGVKYLTVSRSGVDVRC